MGIRTTDAGGEPRGSCNGHVLQREDEVPQRIDGAGERVDAGDDGEPVAHRSDSSVRDFAERHAAATPPRTAGQRAVIKSPSHRLAAWPSWLRPGGQSARLYIYTSPCLGRTSASAAGRTRVQQRWAELADAPMSGTMKQVTDRATGEPAAGTGDLASVFTGDATYLKSPYEQPITGLDAIKRMWEQEREGPDEVFALATDIVAVDGPTAVVRADICY